MYVHHTSYRSNTLPREKIHIFAIVLTLLFLHPVSAQDDLELKNMTISETKTYEASNSISAGPEFVITSKGIVTFKSGNFITLKPGFVILNGGEFYGLTKKIIDEIAEEKPGLPNKFILHQNYPNPFNPTTNIDFSIPKTSNVVIKIYNYLGQEVITLLSERLNTGDYTYRWNASNLASGIYIYRLNADNFTETKKMILLR